MSFFIRLVICLLLVFYLFDAPAHASDKNNVSEIDSVTSIQSLNGVRYLQSKDKLNVKELTGSSNWTDQFAPSGDLKILAGHDVWIILPVVNHAASDLNLYYFTANNQYCNAYLIDTSNVIVDAAFAGNFNNPQNRRIRDFSIIEYLKVPAESDGYLLFCISNHGQQKASPDILLFNEAIFDKIALSSFKSERTATYIKILFQGAAGFTFVFFTFLYFKNRQKIYLYYSIYLMGLLWYSILRMYPYTLTGHLHEHFPLFMASINEPVQLVSLGFYCLFAIELLGIDKKDPWLNKGILILAYTLFTYSLLHFLFLYFSQRLDLSTLLFAITRSILLPANAIFLVLIGLRIKSPLTKYLIAGNLFFLIGALLASLIWYFNGLDWLGGFFANQRNSQIVFMLSILAETLCFAFALGYKIKITEDEKNQSREAYIQQLRFNQEITEKANKELEEKIAVRTREILEKTRELEAQKEWQLKTEFERKLAQAEMMALRAQMNPHFLFNCMNAIKHLILTKDEKSAAIYLSKFSKLLRLILHHSKENSISLSQELEALTLYLELEKSRFGDEFKYALEIDEEIDLDYIQVPPLLLQPFVENAIWHGIMHSQRNDKTVFVKINETNKGFHFCIEDNGIGRKKSAELKGNSLINTRSYGMEITHERIELFNKNFGSTISLDVKDRNIHLDEPGTVVEILYKHSHYDQSSNS
ncbi:MAG: histidine kinase [Cyclobacteriaceae bacterium]|nr:histidine kinase [Cyclobacteriaceae bacterium]